MDYALAKELKDAGFPQGGEGRHVGPPDKIVWRRDDRVYTPTLSELIAACGDRLSTIRRVMHRGERGWLVGQDSGGSTSPGNQVFARDLDVAVARLWLALDAREGDP